MMDSSGKSATACYIKLSLLTLALSSISLISSVYAKGAALAGRAAQQNAGYTNQPYPESVSTPLPALSHHGLNLYTPAVSDVNGWLGGSVGGWHSRSTHSNSTSGASLIANGGVTLPFTNYLGLQIDGYDGSLSHENLFLVDGDFFIRKPSTGLIGFHYRYADIEHIYANLYGLHVEMYLNQVTLSADGGSIHTNTRHGQSYGQFLAGYYPTPNWRFDIGYLNIAGLAAGQVGTEYQVTNLSVPGVAAYAAVGGGNHNLYYGYLGLKVYLGACKNLINRHREDTLDPAYDLLAGREIKHLS
jgi:hypothetical protein